MSHNTLRMIFIVVSCSLFIMFFLIFQFLVSSCTISFQNISTHGTATDLVDENQSPTNTVSPNLNIPVKPL